MSARGEGRRTWKAGSWLGKSFDTFAPIGPCITTADEIPDPNNVIVRFWDDGQLRHNYNTDDMEHRVPELVEFASSIMTLNSGDLIACGTNHEGLGALQDGERVEIEVAACRPHGARCRRSAEAELGEGRLYGRRFDKPRSRPPPPPAGLSARFGGGRAAVDVDKAAARFFEDARRADFELGVVAAHP